MIVSPYSHEVKAYISELQTHVAVLKKQLGERHEDATQLVRLLEKSQRRLRLQTFKQAALKTELSSLRPLQDEVATLRVQVSTLAASAQEDTSVNASRKSLSIYDAPLVSRDAALVLGSECFRVSRPTGGSGTRVAVNPRSVLEHYTD